MKKVIIAFVGLIALMAVGIAALFVLPMGTGAGAASPLTDIKALATNTLIDASGLKHKVETALRENSRSIASATGLSEADVSQAIAGLDIPSWSASALPSTANVTETFEGTYSGIDGSVTLYDDPGYITVDAYGQTVTLAIPPSAQAYLSYLDTDAIDAYLAQAA